MFDERQCGFDIVDAFGIWEDGSWFFGFFVDDTDTVGSRRESEEFIDICLLDIRLDDVDDNRFGEIFVGFEESVVEKISEFTYGFGGLDDAMRGEDMIGLIK